TQWGSLILNSQVSTFNYLNGHYFFFFSGVKLIDLFDKLIMDFLNLCLGVFLYVLGNPIRLDAFLQSLNSVTTSVTNADLRILRLLLTLFHQLTATLLSQRRNT